MALNRFKICGVVLFEVYHITRLVWFGFGRVMGGVGWFEVNFP